MNNKNYATVLNEAGFFLDPELNIWCEISEEKFGYNDGDEYENYVLDVVTNASDCSVMSSELATKIKDWPSLYHLTPKRSNLLRPFTEQFRGKRVLEIGCGCGAITRFLGESGAEVVSVEGSKRRATIARRRCYDLENVQVICASSEKLPDLGQFDYVMLIGVLEYAQSFLGAGGPGKLLESCRTRLTPSGSLFVAIENKLGLKYLAGAKEDHLGVPMLGINNAYPELGVITFGRQELKTLLQDSGYLKIEEYLPFPDYKLPTLIIAPEGHLSKSKALYPLVSESYHKEAQPLSDYTFSLEEASTSVWANGLSADLSNSFLMISSPASVVSDRNNHEEVDETSLAWYYSESRKDNKQKAINFVTKGDDIKVKVFKMNGEFIHDEEFHQGESLWLELVSILNKHGWQRAQLVNFVKNWIGIVTEKAGIELVYAWDMKVPVEYLDATPFNIIKTSAGYEIFDLELNAEQPLNLSSMIFRGLFHSFLRITSVSPTSDVSDYNIFNLTQAVISDVFPNAPEELCANCLRDEVWLMREIATTDTTALYENYKSVSFIARNFLNDYRTELSRLHGVVNENAEKINLQTLSEIELANSKASTEVELNNCREENKKLQDLLNFKEAQLNRMLESRGGKILTLIEKFRSGFKK
ncbi:class I SAM-dependent methyltransferase [Erwinia billingiae]|uniref:class I SAM-dependent methyltransferase n=1 Tax=Erwinia billingiae TaxID=182337 RepID=UPI00320A2ACF